MATVTFPERHSPGSARPAGLPVLALIVLALALALGTPGCKLFDPAKPETPTEGGQVILANYTTIDSCLKYMRVGIEAKSNQGQTAYLGTLADPNRDGASLTFHATFDPVDLAAFSNKPSDWVLDDETKFYGFLVQRFGGDLIMTWDVNPGYPGETWNEQSPEVLIHRQYEIRNAKTTGDTVLVARGYADLTFTRVQTRWALRQWDDHVAPRLDPNNQDERTLGYRRLESRGGG